jgi:hypothetical protein
MIKNFNEYFSESLTNPEKAEIAARCRALGIIKFSINDDKSINVNDDVLLNGDRWIREDGRVYGRGRSRSGDASKLIRPEKLTKIPIKFNIVKGDFNISNNSLISLENCPKIVERNFICSQNKLESIDFFPDKVGKIERHPTYHTESMTGGGIYFNNNNIYNLYGMNVHSNAIGMFNIQSNPIEEIFKFVVSYKEERYLGLSSDIMCIILESLNMWKPIFNRNKLSYDRMLYVLEDMEYRRNIFNRYNLKIPKDIKSEDFNQYELVK